MAKIIGIIVLIVAVAVFGYVLFWPDSAPETSSTPTASATISSSPAPSLTTTPTANAIRVFTITASNFKFSVPQITVKKGETIKIILAGTEATHDWVIDEFNVRIPKIQEGQTAEITFIADKAGTFEYYCSIGTHRAMGMKGNLIVQ